MQQLLLHLFDRVMRVDRRQRTSGRQHALVIDENMQMSHQCTFTDKGGSSVILIMQLI